MKKNRKKSYARPQLRRIALHGREGVAGFVVGSDSRETDEQWTRRKAPDGDAPGGERGSLWDDMR